MSIAEAFAMADNAVPQRPDKKSGERFRELYGLVCLLMDLDAAVNPRLSPDKCASDDYVNAPAQGWMVQ